MISVRADHGGGPRHIELLLQNLPADVEASVACPDEQPYRSRFEHLVRGRAFTIPHRRFDPGAALRLAGYVRRQGVDVIHAHGKGAGPYARVAAMLTGRPSVHTPHGVQVSRYGDFARKLYSLYENGTAAWVDHVVFVSDEECEVAREAGLWSRTPHSVIPNGVDEVVDKRRESLRVAGRRSLGVADGRVIIVTLSRFDFQKNMQEAYEVAKASPDCLFVWIGDGDDAAELSRRARDEGVDNLRFLGKLDDPASILAAADVYFSSARWEGLPLAVLEAMAMGLPVIASEVTGHREIVGDSGGGLLYPSGEPTQATALLARLADDAALRRQLGERGREVQRARYSSRRMTEEMCDVYRQLQRKRGR
jgi:glycosyltransferase involved in cell wall biosynthesis